MKKTLVALAALAATASFAQVTIYGRAHVAIDNWSAGGTAAAANIMKSRTRVADDGSRIGLSINEDLGGGLRAFSVIETGINLDNAAATGQGGQANSGTGYFGTREAHVGIGNKSAEIRLGRQNVYWGNGAIEDTAANQIHGGVYSVYTAQSSGWVAAPAARMDNTVQVIGNDALGAFKGSSIWYSVGATGVGEAAGQNLNSNSTARGLTLKYVQGPLAVQFDNAVNNSIASAANGAAFAAADFKATGNKLGVAYTYAPGSKVAISSFKMEREYLLAATNAAALTIAADGVITAQGARSQGGIAMGVNHNLGNGLQGIVQYVKQGDVAGLADSGSTAYALGIRKDLSKRTSLSASYNVIDNGVNNNIHGTGGSQSSSLTNVIGAGATAKMVGVGIQHNF